MCLQWPLSFEQALLAPPSLSELVKIGPGPRRLADLGGKCVSRNPALLIVDSTLAFSFLSF